jgi:putative ABC transport system permease protein
MEFTELIKEALVSLTLNKMRTALATLGIIIGTGSVIALISLGQASQKQVQTQIQSLGSNLLTVMPGAQNSGGIRGAQGSIQTLTYEDAKAISTSSQITTVKTVSPEVQKRSQVIAGKNNTNTQIIGATPVYTQVHNLNISSGNFLSQRDIDSMTNNAVLGPTAASDLFGESTDPIGQTIKINGQLFKVIGVTVSKGGSGFNNPDDQIFIPLTTAQTKLFGMDYLSSISLEAVDANDMTTAQNQVGYLLLSRHKLSDPSQADFIIMSQQDILGAASQITGTITALLSGIAAISLIVGGIGIMNIMLVTVTERTREIGLRKALGAKKKLVITQFLIESIILTFTGGIIGVIIGALVSLILSNIMSLPFTLAVHSVLLALGVSGGIGILFGWYPARKAAQLQPIEALRYE